MQRVSPTAVFYALNPKRRVVVAKAGKQRTLYFQDAFWEALQDQALEAGLSASAMALAIMTGAAPVIAVEPAIPGATAEAGREK